MDVNYLENPLLRKRLMKYARKTGIRLISRSLYACTALNHRYLWMEINGLPSFLPTII